MSRPPPVIEAPAALAHVWSGLPSDLRQRAVLLLAQLAHAQFRTHTPPATQEIRHGHGTQPQDSSRPS